MTPNTPTDRTTFLITTENGHTVLIRDYMTGNEKRQITTLYVRETEDRAARIFEAEDLAIRLLVVSLDDSTENIVERILELPTVDSEAITAALKPIVEGKKKTEVTPS